MNSLTDLVVHLLILIIFACMPAVTYPSHTHFMLSCWKAYKLHAWLRLGLRTNIGHRAGRASRVVIDLSYLTSYHHYKLKIIYEMPITTHFLSTPSAVNFHFISVWKGKIQNKGAVRTIIICVQWLSLDDVPLNLTYHPTLFMVCIFKVHTVKDSHLCLGMLPMIIPNITRALFENVLFLLNISN